MLEIGGLFVILMEPWRLKDLPFTVVVAGGQRSLADPSLRWLLHYAGIVQDDIRRPCAYVGNCKSIGKPRFLSGTICQSVLR